MDPDRRGGDHRAREPEGAALRSHALVVGYPREALFERYAKIPVADIVGGKCVGCSRPVYVNAFGASAIRERDADVVCTRCESLYDADINHSLIES